MKTNFQMRPSLMWIVSNFSTYSMLSRWSTYGKTACPYCMEDTDAFQLSFEGKSTWFDYHRHFLLRYSNERKNKSSFHRDRIVLDKPPANKSGEYILHKTEALGVMEVTELGSNAINNEVSKTNGWRK
ncbi:hypothetical protein Syun_007276 [Stephania yunnanensis]|uniref:Uncharacterized protein n=1 Tax=Stephania yunnanensis TaxID=152371 RepID=A0AAP0L0T1_9MAGN